MSSLSRSHKEPGFGALHAFFVVAVLVAGCMFTFKVWSFVKTVARDELAGFASDPIIVYAFVALGFLFLLAWAYLSGQFRDIEAPKHEMLERWNAQERLEAERDEEGATPHA